MVPIKKKSLSSIACHDKPLETKSYLSRTCFKIIKRIRQEFAELFSVFHHECEPSATEQTATFNLI